MTTQNNQHRERILVVDDDMELNSRQPGLPVMMVTGFGSIDTAVEAMRIGATDI